MSAIERKGKRENGGRESERFLFLYCTLYMHRSDALIGTLEVGIKSNVLCIHNNVGTI